MKESLLFIPYYNDPLGLIRSLNSIPNQSNIDLLIIDDGSTTPLLKQEVTSIAEEKGVKLTLLKKPENEGIAHTRNYALKYTQEHSYKYLFFLDCGDTISNKRITCQLNYLKQNPDCMIVGSHVHFVDEDGQKLFDLKLPTQWNEIKQKMYFNSMLIQPAVTLNTDLLQSHPTFPTKYEAAEDYAYFMNVCKEHRVNNIPEFLTTTFVNLKGISNTKRKKQVHSRIKVILKNFHLGYYPIIGLIRSCILLFFPLKFTALIKGLLYRNESKN